MTEVEWHVERWRRFTVAVRDDERMVREQRWVDQHQLHTLTDSSDEQIEHVSLAMCCWINMLQMIVADLDVGQLTGVRVKNLVEVDIESTDDDDRWRVRNQPFE